MGGGGTVTSDDGPLSNVDVARLAEQAGFETIATELEQAEGDATPEAVGRRVGATVGRAVGEAVGATVGAALLPALVGSDDEEKRDDAVRLGDGTDEQS